MTMVFSQTAPFTGPAYEYLRADDALPSYREIADEPDPLCRVKLFQPAQGGRTLSARPPSTRGSTARS
ncbi:MAG: hypothetical protein ACRDL4_00630 [Thermoleophilaceae bacterium]